jgi:hypothetical protein
MTARKDSTHHEPHEGLEHPPRPVGDEDERVDESIDESFPASDPPSFTPSRTGAPSEKPDSPNTGGTK